VKNKGNTRSSVDPKLRKRRDLKNLLLQKKLPARKKEGMCNWLLQEHMNIVRHGWLNLVNPFILLPTWTESINMKGMMEVMFY
jgi:hypothetical protein